MASNQGEESGDQNPNQDQEQSADRPWLRITPVLAQNLEPQVPNPPVAVRRVIGVTQSTEPHRILEHDIPRPLEALGEGEIKAYAEGYEPEAGKEGDTTEWVHGQTYAHENNLPRRFRLMLLARTHEEFEKTKEHKRSKRKKKNKDERENLTDENGNEVSLPVKKKGGIVTEIQIKENPILPRHISSQIEGWRIAMWMMYDPDITYRDIHARIRKRFRNSGRKKSKKDNEKHKTKENEEETGVYTYLSQRLPRWRRSARGGQFSTEERQNTRGEPSEHDRITASNHFDRGPGTLNDDDKLAHFNNMASGGRLNKIYWNTPWDIFQTKNDDGTPEILVQQRNAMVKDTYFRADNFSSDPRDRERVYHALWKIYFPTEENSNEDQPRDEYLNEDQPRDEYLQRNFDSILSIMKKLEVNYGAIQKEVLKREQQEKEGTLDFTSEFGLGIAKVSALVALGYTIQYLGRYWFDLGLSKRWTLLKDGEKIKNIRDIDADPTRAAERLKEAIAFLFADLRQILESWDRIALAKSKFDEIETPEECSILSGHQIKKTVVIDELVTKYRTEYIRLTQLRDAFIQKQKDRPNLDLETERQELNRDMEEVAGRFLSLLRMQAEFLAPPIVYYLKPFEDGIETAGRYTKLIKIFHALRVMFVLESERHQPRGSKNDKFYTLSQAARDLDLRNDLSGKSLQDFLMEKSKSGKNAGTGGKKPTGMVKEPKGKADPSGKGKGAGGAAAASGSGSGTSLDTTIGLGLQSEVGNTPTDPYGENTSFNDLFSQYRLNGELDRVLRAHQISVEFPQDKTTFFQRLHHVLATLEFEDVLGHLRISTPIVEALRNPRVSIQDPTELQNTLAIACDVNLALMHAGYGESGRDVKVDPEGFLKDVADNLALIDEDWARSVRASKGWDNAEEGSSGRKSDTAAGFPEPVDQTSGIDFSPTTPYNNVSPEDMLNPDRLRRELQSILTAHGIDRDIPEEITSPVKLLKHVIETCNFADVLGHYRISVPVLHIFRNTDVHGETDWIITWELADVVDDALQKAGYTTKSLMLSEQGFLGALLSKLEEVQEAWVARVRKNLKPTGGAANGSGKRPTERQTVAPITPVVGTSPIEGGGYKNLYKEDGSLDRARFNNELDRVLQSHEYTANFGDDEAFEDRIEKVVTAGFVDVLGHYRIAVPIMEILRKVTDDDATHRLAFSVDGALQEAGYTDAPIDGEEFEGADKEPDYHKEVAKQLQDALLMWTAQVRFTLQNNTDYALAHPRNPQPEGFRRLF